MAEVATVTAGLTVAAKAEEDLVAAAKAAARAAAVTEAGEVGVQGEAAWRPPLCTKKF